MSYPNHNKGTVYRIICLPNPEIQYVGSTFQPLRYRWQAHKQSFNSWLKNRTKNISIYPYFEAYGIENFKIIPIKEYLCYKSHKNDRKHLESKEQLWISRLKCVNKRNPFRINKMYEKNYYEENKEQEKERSKKYREENKEKEKERNKKYYEENKEHLQKYQKQYREDNKEKTQERHKKYREKNKEKIQCECGSIICKISLTRHKKTKKHQNFIKNK